MQGRQALEELLPVFRLAVPAEQFAHDGEPGELEYVPIGHIVHCDDPRMEYVPEGQIRQTVPFVLEYVPAGHGVQLAAPTPDIYP